MAETLSTLISQLDMRNISGEIAGIIKEEVKRLIDVKFVANSQNDVENYAALILYEENMNPGKEDPQIYE